jgi:HEAT repeat protein
MMFNPWVSMARIRKIAERAHRGQLYAGGGLFVAHLQRAADEVARLGGAAATVQAVWLHAVPAAGIDVQELLARGVPVRVVRMVERLQQRPGEFPAAFTERLLLDRRAALARHAVLTDWHRHLAGQHTYEYVRDQHTRLADALGLPRPAAGPAPDPIDVARLSGWRPSQNKHWGPVARQLTKERGPHALPILLAAYGRLTGDKTRTCCLAGVRAAIYAIADRPTNIPPEQIGDLAARWWTSTDRWEEQVAVVARATAGNPADRDAFLGKLESDDHGVVIAAIKGLTGAGDQTEVAHLRRVIIRPDSGRLEAQQAAARRLAQIGGPEAEEALDQQRLDPADPPWRADRGWLTRNGAAMIPTLIDKLADPAWQFEATYALGELRTPAAAGPICDALTTVSFGLAHIEALGKIGSAEAVPALLHQTGHDHPDIRDHALRALDRVGDPRVVDAAIAGCDDPHPVVRDRAARVLARHADERAVVALIRLCDGRHAAIAAEALVRVGDPRALPTLWRLFQTAPDRRTRHTAGRGLARIDGRREHVHGADVRVRRAYMWLLGHKPAWNPQYALLRALSDGDPLVRARAAEALARLRDHLTAPQIRVLLDDPDPRVRAAAATALATLGNEQTLHWLDSRQEDPHPSVRSAITAALRRVNDAKR